MTPRFKAFVDEHRPHADAAPIDFLVDLNQRLQREIRYLIRMEPGVQTPEETLENGARLVPRLGLAAGADCCATAGWRRASCPAT